MATGVGMRPALLLLLTLLSAPSLTKPAMAETKCTTKTYVCVDGKQGARLCITTICIDDKGDILSTDTIVLNEGEQTGSAGQKDKTQLRDMNVRKQLDKAISK